MVNKNKSNLVTLLFNNKDCKHDCPLTVVGGVPKEVTLFLEEGNWSIRGLLFRVGESDGGRLSYSGNPHGPIGIYDRANVSHLQEMVNQVREFTERRKR